MAAAAILNLLPMTIFVIWSSLGDTGGRILASPIEMVSHPYNSAALPRSLWCMLCYVLWLYSSLLFRRTIEMPLTIGTFIVFWLLFCRKVASAALQRMMRRRGWLEGYVGRTANAACSGMAEKMISLFVPNLLPYVQQLLFTLSEAENLKKN